MNRGRIVCETTRPLTRTFCGKDRGRWLLYVRYRDAHGKQIETKAGPDRSMAQRIANGMESQVRAIKTGTADPREAGWAEAERKPLTDHVHDWHAGLAARGRNAVYVQDSKLHVLRLIEMTRATKVSHLNILTIQLALAELRSLPGRAGNVGLSDQSVRHHARQIKQFMKWLWRDGRVREDPLVHLAAPTNLTRKTHNDLAPEAAAGLIATTRTQPFRWRLTGEDRSILYAIALGTGFRAGELRPLKPEDFNLDADPPTITCRAAYTKNRKEAVQPIRPELAELAIATWSGLSPCSGNTRPIGMAAVGRRRPCAGSWVFGRGNSCTTGKPRRGQGVLAEGTVARQVSRGEGRVFGRGNSCTTGKPGRGQGVWQREQLHDG